MTTIAAISNFLGANQILHPRLLPDGLGVESVNMRRGSVDFRPIRSPVPVVADTPAVSSLLIGDTKVEGNTLVYTCTLAFPAILPAIYSISWGGGTASSGDYISLPTFTNGVTLISGNTQIVVPAGVGTFNINIATVDDTASESTETVPLTIGGVTAIGQIIDNDVLAAWCPINSYRELTIPTFAGVTYYGRPVPSAPPTISSLLMPNYYGNGQPSLHGTAWKIEATASNPNGIVEIEVNDPSLLRADVLYFEYIGGLLVDIDLQDIYGASYPSASGAIIDQSAFPEWRRTAIDTVGGGARYIKRVRFKYNPVAGGIAAIINVRLYCGSRPEYSPTNQAPVIAGPYSIPSSLTVVAPGSTAYTDEYVDSAGVNQISPFPPQATDGASDYGDAWVLGSPLDATNTLTITVNDTSTVKHDCVSFESNGDVMIEVWDDLANLAGPPSYTFSPAYRPSGLWGRWRHYRSFPLVHPPIGTQGNIKRVRLTGLDPANGMPLTGSSTNLWPASIFNFQLSPSNSVSPRTDVGTMVYS